MKRILFLMMLSILAVGIAENKSTDFKPPIPHPEVTNPGNEMIDF